MNIASESSTGSFSMEQQSATVSFQGLDQFNSRQFVFFFMPRLEQQILSDDDMLRIEKENYEKKKDELVKQYEGVYVALYNGQVLDKDKSYSALAKRVYDNSGYKSIYIPFVSKSERTLKLLTPKFSPKKSVE